MPGINSKNQAVSNASNAIAQIRKYDGEKRNAYALKAAQGSQKNSIVRIDK